MPKITLKGIIKQISPIEYRGLQNVKHQTFMLHVPAFRNRYDEKTGADQHWSINLYGDKVDQMDLVGRKLQNAKAEVEVYVTSYMFEDAQQQPKTFIKANLSNLVLEN